jgi:glycosyltransferase involved in cell wall biosynthesis
MKGINMDAILTNYPLSRDFQSRLAVLVPPDALQLSVGELRQRPLLQMLKYLRALNVNRLFLPIEDENGAVLLPVLKLLASVVPARSIFLVGSDMRLQSVSRMEAIGSMFKLVHASAAARAAVVQARREVTGLLTEVRAAVDMPSGQNALYLNANLWFGVKAGGSVGHISGVVNALLQAGYTVNFASAGGQLLVSDKAIFTKLQPPSHFGFPWELNYYRFHFDVVDQVKRLVEQQHIDFIYQRLSIANYTGVVLSRWLGVPLIIEYNGSEAWIARNWGRPLREQVLAEQVEETNLRHAHLVVTISDVLRDELLQRGVPLERIVSYPNCIDPEMFDPARFSVQDISELRSRHTIPLDAVVVTFIGTFGQWHGAEILAQAIRQLFDDHKEWIETKRVHFLLVGDGLKMPEARSTLGEYAYGPHVTLAGLVPQHEAPLYLAASDILSSPHVSNADGSRFFGSPTKLFEYMAMGKAIVASDLDQIGVVLASSLHASELPADDLSVSDEAPLAVLCQPGSATQHAAGIHFLVEHPMWRQQIGVNARREALNRYTWRHHVQAIFDRLQDIGD